MESPLTRRQVNMTRTLYPVPRRCVRSCSPGRSSVFQLANSQLHHEALAPLRGFNLLRLDLGGESHAGVTNDLVQPVVAQVADVDETHLQTKTGKSSHRHAGRRVLRSDVVVSLKRPLKARR